MEFRTVRLFYNGTMEFMNKEGEIDGIMTSPKR
jgi:hypothetical protein